MRITGKIAQQMIKVLDDLHEEIEKESKEPYSYAEWERQRALASGLIHSDLTNIIVLGKC